MNPQCIRQLPQPPSQQPDQQLIRQRDRPSRPLRNPHCVPVEVLLTGRHTHRLSRRLLIQLLSQRPSLVSSPLWSQLLSQPISLRSSRRWNPPHHRLTDPQQSRPWSPLRLRLRGRPKDLRRPLQHGLLRSLLLDPQRRLQVLPLPGRLLDLPADQPRHHRLFLLRNRRIALHKSPSTLVSNAASSLLWRISLEMAGAAFGCL